MMGPLVRAACMSGQHFSTWRAMRSSQRVFVGVCALVFIASVAATLAHNASMSAMGALPMPGGWSMSTLWMPTCGRTWARTAASFIGMWIVMMAAMMLPSLMPTLLRYRDAVGARASSGRLALLTVLVSGAYAVVWTALGVAVFALGASLATLELRWLALARSVPLAAGVVVLLAGALQLSTWKARRLACCRAIPSLAADAASAWRYGLRIGVDCAGCCAGLTAILLVAGMMDLRLMAAVTAAITAERVAPDGARVARAIGAIAIGVAGWLLVQAVSAG
ncbi:putative metal-binding membrane protein [Paraburkholderia youngii]